MIRLDAVSLAPGGHDLLVDATWHVHPGEKVGLVGRNGSGKTSLLRVIAGERSPEDGRVNVRPGARLGYLPQQAVSGSTASVWDEARSQMGWLDALREPLESAERRVQAGEVEAIAQLEEVTEAFRQGGGYAADEAVGEVLHGLGFASEDWHRSCETFSGGWQMRIALARLLLSRPDVALLDEPTNHLDLPARAWLASYLSRSPITVVIVSHDRYLLDRVTTKIAELSHKRLHTYTGDFGDFLRERELRHEQHSTAFARQQDERAKLQRFVDRFGAKATKAAQARSRQKQLDKMQLIDAPEAHKLPRFRLAEASPGAQEALSLVGAELAWPDGPTVLSDVELTLSRGMRLAVLGPNGAGKSTLLHALAGRLPLRAGRRKLGDRTRIGVFTQDLAAELPSDISGLDYIAGHAPAVPPQRIRSILGALGLYGDHALRIMGQLSGGEKARVALTALSAQSFNCLLLDEPTNHLDIETVEVLVRALEGYEGAMLLVSHDRYLVEQVATHVLLVHHGTVVLREGVRPEDFDTSKPPRGTEPSVAAPSAAKLDHAERKKQQRRVERAKRRVESLGQEVEAAEAQLERIDTRLFEVGGDFEAARALGEERGELERTIEALYAEWEELEALLEGETD